MSISIRRDDDLKKLADKVRAKNLVIGSVVAPVWGGTGGGSAMGGDAERTNFLTQVRKGCRIAKRLRELGIRPYGIVRIDSACGPGDWLKDPEGNQKRIAETFRLACDIAADHGERLAAEGEICWGGMHSWKRMVQLLELTDRPGVARLPGGHGPHPALHARLQRPGGSHRAARTSTGTPRHLDKALATLTAALRPWTIDFHIAQNDATVKGSGSHDKTGRHCLPDDPNGKLKIAHHAGFWMRDSYGNLTKKFKHVCWDGCMFPNEVMKKPETWNRHPGGDDRGARGAWVECVNVDSSPPQFGEARFCQSRYSMVFSKWTPMQNKPLSSLSCQRTKPWRRIGAFMP